MKKYAILYNPGHNRVYFEASLGLSAAEFSVVCKNLSGGYTDLSVRKICGIEYLAFSTEKELSISDIETLCGLSFAYALYEMAETPDSLYLRPIEKPKMDFIDASIGTILKYTGKTNEFFTKMLLNIAYYSYKAVPAREINLLDPVAGKGTTLFEGAVKGFNVRGIEIAEDLVNESYHFLKRFLEKARYKFDHKLLRISGANKSFKAQRHTFETAPTKEDFKSKNTRTIEFIAGNSMYADKYYKKNFFDLIVGDLPYGVQHGNVTNKKQASLTRNPKELLAACLPAWGGVLKKGGVVVLSWNENVLPRPEVWRVFAENGLRVLTEEPYTNFKHRVDQSILRDVITAVKE